VRVGLFWTDYYNHVAHIIGALLFVMMMRKVGGGQTAVEIRGPRYFNISGNPKATLFDAGLQGKYQFWQWLVWMKPRWKYGDR